ncbi:hypothetical protein HNQ80_001133 [Anaerosolibacter carboniphilus]|uniref:DUF4825 domain-containing protein n=1 Tax=Anaerosolibacter carboniphilus TaxID=1417629 RepID=A0A841KMM4_9FIRM|nr:hypothetical protein [Anaerosolibacter carboniphilus]MBB6215044.1 hypothetical protein [Anaerosolibacter carboniphilus]
MSKKIIIVLIIAISIISFYIFFTQPINFNDAANIGSIEDIEEIRIYAHYRKGSFGSSYDLIIDDKNDIDEVINILDNYKYSKKFSFKNLMPGDSENITGKTYSFMQIFITHSSSKNQIMHQRLTIDSYNTVNIDYTTGRHWESEYNTSESDKNIFEGLSDWLNPLIEKDNLKF